MLTKDDLFAAKDTLQMAAVSEEETRDYIENTLGVNFLDLAETSLTAVDSSMPALLGAMLAGPEGMAMAMASIFQLGFTVALQARINADEIPTV